MIILGVGVIYSYASRITYNPSPSIPVGFYILTDTAIAPGAIVRYPIPDAARAFFEGRDGKIPYVNFLKPVVAIAGDRVCVTADRATAAGRDLLPPEATDATGHALPSWRGCLDLPAGQTFVYSPAPHSLDSRYTGPIAVSSISGVFKPLWTW